MDLIKIMGWVSLGIGLSGIALIIACAMLELALWVFLIGIALLILGFTASWIFCVDAGYTSELDICPFCKSKKVFRAGNSRFCMRCRLRIE